MRWSAATDSWAGCSFTKPSTALSTMITRMHTVRTLDNPGDDRRSDGAGKLGDQPIGKLGEELAQAGTGVVASSWFGPYSAKRAAASDDHRPGRHDIRGRLIGNLCRVPQPRLWRGQCDRTHSPSPHSPPHPYAGREGEHRPIEFGPDAQSAGISLDCPEELVDVKGYRLPGASHSVYPCAVQFLVDPHTGNASWQPNADAVPGGAMPEPPRHQLHDRDCNRLQMPSVAC